MWTSVRPHRLGGGGADASLSAPKTSIRILYCKSNSRSINHPESFEGEYRQKKDIAGCEEIKLVINFCADIFRQDAYLTASRSRFITQTHLADRCPIC